MWIFEESMLAADPVKEWQKLAYGDGAEEARAAAQALDGVPIMERTEVLVPCMLLPR